MDLNIKPFNGQHISANTNGAGCTVTLFGYTAILTADDEHLVRLPEASHDAKAFLFLAHGVWLLQELRAGDQLSSGLPLIPYRLCLSPKVAVELVLRGFFDYDKLSEYETYELPSGAPCLRFRATPKLTKECGLMDIEVSPGYFGLTTVDIETAPITEPVPPEELPPAPAADETAIIKLVGTDLAEAAEAIAEQS